MTLLEESNSAISISLPGVFLDVPGLARNIVGEMRTQNLAVSPSWVQSEVERQLTGSKSSSSPGNRVAAHLRAARLL